MGKAKALTITAVFVAGVVGLGFLLLSAKAGDIVPPGPPGPTMKTLDEVEPRIPIPASATPARPFTIKTPGSYYLIGDRMALENGIDVSVDDVTIDLMGYRLIGPGSGTNYGIYMNACANVEIRNGTIRDFGNSGIYETSGLNVKGHRIIAVRVLSNDAIGIYLPGYDHLVKDCIVVDNGATGIYTSGSILTGNTSCNNGNRGIAAGARSVVTGNTVYGNTFGIEASAGSTVSGNVVTGNDYDGIWATSLCTVSGNTVINNNQSESTTSAGIRVSGDCLIKSNMVSANKKCNIWIDGTDNSVEENLVTDCTPGCGIIFTGTGNFYANNRASGNGTNFAGTAGNTDGGGNYEF